MVIFHIFNVQSDFFFVCFYHSRILARRAVGNKEYENQLPGLRFTSRRSKVKPVFAKVPVRVTFRKKRTTTNPSK